MTKLTWLHLSDWHQKGKEFDRKVVLDGLLADIQDRAKISPDLKRIDFYCLQRRSRLLGKARRVPGCKREFAFAFA